MITHANQITIFVKDMDEAKAFYTEKLGFVVCTDTELGPGWRYLTVAPNPNNETILELALANAEQEKLVGKQSIQVPLIMFLSNDIESDYHELKTHGVTFHGEPTPVLGGKGVVFEDLYGNMLDLFQPDPEV